MPWTLECYLDARGNNPVEEFIEALPVADRASLRARIDFLAEVSNRAWEPLSESLADPLKKTHMQRCAQSSRYNVRAVYASARR